MQLWTKFRISMHAARQQAHSLNTNSIDGLHGNKYPDGKQTNHHHPDAAHVWILASTLVRTGSWYSGSYLCNWITKAVMMAWVRRNEWVDYEGMEGITAWLNGRLHQGKLA